jgi:hypothetical protein
MPLKAGTVTSFANSMAAAMENALKEEWRRTFARDMPNSEMQVYWRVLLVGVAQGIVRHLKEQAQDAFRIDVDVTQTSAAIESRNPTAIDVGSFSGGGSLHLNAEELRLFQLSGAAQLVQSKGAGVVVELKTDPNSPLYGP